MQIREAKRSEGVPRETLEKNCLADLAAALTQITSDVDKEKLTRMALQNSYFEATMTKQLDILAEIALKVAGESSVRVLEVLVASPAEKVNAVGVCAIAAIYPENLDAKLNWLRKTAALSGTWPREQSCGALHMLFIRHGVAAILERVLPWLKESNEGVRRVVTEGIRPRLMMVPHIGELKNDPSVLKMVFEPLLDDPSMYVRKSVGNCMNDVSKDHPGVLLDWLDEWFIDPLSKERRQIFERGLRTLIKKGEDRAYRILGIPFRTDLDVKVLQGFPEKVQLNQVISLALEVSNSRHNNANTILDIVVKAPGKSQNVRKFVFKIPIVEIKPEEKKIVKKTIHFTDKTTQKKEDGQYEVYYRKNSEEFFQEQFTFTR